jgi:DNA gyrase subunit B
VRFTDAQGAERKINWEMAHAPEYRQMMSKYKQIEQYMEPPFVIERAAGLAAEEARKKKKRAPPNSKKRKRRRRSKVAKKRKAEDEVVEKTVRARAVRPRPRRRQARITPCSATKAWAR